MAIKQPRKESEYLSDVQENLQKSRLLPELSPRGNHRSPVNQSAFPQSTILNGAVKGLSLLSE